MPVSPMDRYFDEFNYLLHKHYDSKSLLTHHEVINLSKLLVIWDATLCEEEDICRQDTCRLASLPSWLSIDGRFSKLCDYIDNLQSPSERSKTNDFFLLPRFPGSFGSNC